VGGLLAQCAAKAILISLLVRPQYSAAFGTFQVAEKSLEIASLVLTLMDLV
jgi:hypothetical protein